MTIQSFIEKVERNIRGMGNWFEHFYIEIYEEEIKVNNEELFTKLFLSEETIDFAKELVNVLCENKGKNCCIYVNLGGDWCAFYEVFHNEDEIEKYWKDNYNE